MNVSLTPELEDYTREKVQSGLYTNPSEVICEALRLLRHRDQNADALRQGVVHGFEQVQSGEFSDVSTQEEAADSSGGIFNQPLKAAGAKETIHSEHQVATLRSRGFLSSRKSTNMANCGRIKR